MRYEFHPSALEEYREAALWYAQREAQVAQKFVASVEEATRGSSRLRSVGE